MSDALHSDIKAATMSLGDRNYSVPFYSYGMTIIACGPPRTIIMLCMMYHNHSVRYDFIIFLKRGLLLELKGKRDLARWQSVSLAHTGP